MPINRKPTTVEPLIALLDDPYAAAEFARGFYDPLGAAYESLPPAPHEPPAGAPPWAEFHPLLDLRNRDHVRGWIHTVDLGWIAIGQGAYDDLLACDDRDDVFEVVHGRSGGPLSSGLLYRYQDWTTGKTWTVDYTLWSQPEPYRGYSGPVGRFYRPAYGAWQAVDYPQWCDIAKSWPTPLHSDWPLAVDREATSIPVPRAVFHDEPAWQASLATLLAHPNGQFA